MDIVGPAHAPGGVGVSHHPTRYLASLHATRLEQISSTREAYPRISPLTPRIPCQSLISIGFGLGSAHRIRQPQLRLRQPIVQRIERAPEQPPERSISQLCPSPKPARRPAAYGAHTCLSATKGTLKSQRMLSARLRPTAQGTEAMPIANTLLERALKSLLPPGLRIEIARYQSSPNRLGSETPLLVCHS